MSLSILEQKEFMLAEQELGTDLFNKHFRNVFGIPSLDFVTSLVINLPESCYANCDYCIDTYLRKNPIDNESFLEICEKVLQEFPNTKSIAITGGSLNATDFNRLVDLIKEYFPDSYINWNTNGIGVTEDYLSGISKINHINLHRNSVDDDENKKVFRTGKKILSIEEAKKLFGKRLCLRVTVDENFDLDDYSKQGVPLYLNRLLPGTKSTDSVFNGVVEKLKISNDVDTRRRNVYLTADYQGVPVRICMGDKQATHVPNRRPTFLNVAIVHRSGIVCGSWYEDDKVLYNPYEKEKANDDSNGLRITKIKK